MTNTQQLAQLLIASFSPDASARRDSERKIDHLQNEAGFGHLALELAKDTSCNRSVRQAAALVFKNWVKGNWELVRIANSLFSLPTSRVSLSI